MPSTLSTWCINNRKWCCSWKLERMLMKTVISRYHDIDMTIIAIILDVELFVMHFKQLYIFFWLKGNHEWRRYPLHLMIGNNSLFVTRNFSSSDFHLKGGCCSRLINWALEVFQSNQQQIASLFPFVFLLSHALAWLVLKWVTISLKNHGCFSLFQLLTFTFM